MLRIIHQTATTVVSCTSQRKRFRVSSRMLYLSDLLYKSAKGVRFTNKPSRTARLYSFDMYASLNRFLFLKFSGFKIVTSM